MPRTPDELEQATILSRAPTMVINSDEETAPQNTTSLQRLNAMALADIGFWGHSTELPEYSEEENNNPEVSRPGPR
ncbi:hypothetical protein ACD661_11925 [Legionella lytica]|uniref:Uncharacterized protein n=1 Tax=Legionella lytica TaxID=96232 RepID=A0ABW8DDG4_9GAMM